MRETSILAAKTFWELTTHRILSDEPLIDGIELYTDSTAAISLATKDHVYELNKHVERKCHHMRDLIRHRVIKLQHILAELHLAGLFTKAVIRAKIDRLTTLLCMRDERSEHIRDHKMKFLKREQTREP